MKIIRVLSVLALVTGGASKAHKAAKNQLDVA
jgi:hypothetical protein